MNALLRLALLLALIVPAIPAHADPLAESYLPTPREMGLLAAQGAAKVDAQTTAPADPFQVAVEYVVAGDTYVISAAVLPSLDEAQALFARAAQILETGNERMAVKDDPSLRTEYNVDDLRSYRLVHLAPNSQRRVSNYARLFRVGRFVGQVEGVGDPGADDAGFISNDRGLLTGWTLELAVGKVLAAPPDPLGRTIAGVDDFTRGWSRHGFGLKVEPDGRTSVDWRIYTWCKDSPTPPCDDMQGNLIQSGGRAQVVFFRRWEDHLFGTVIATTQPSQLTIGSVVLVLQPYGMARLEQGSHTIQLCGSDYTQLAPPDVKQTFPCGA